MGEQVLQELPIKPSSPMIHSPFARTVLEKVPEAFQKVAQISASSVQDSGKNKPPLLISGEGELILNSEKEGTTLEGKLKALSVVTQLSGTEGKGLEEVKEITLSKCLSTIPSGTFSGVTNLERVYVPAGHHLQTPESGVFAEGCPSKTCFTADKTGVEEGYNVVIPFGVTEIRDSAFFRCAGLVSVAMPFSVAKIGQAAFCNCADLTSVMIPSSVTEIERNAFESCTSLPSVTNPR